MPTRARAEQPGDGAERLIFSHGFLEPSRSWTDDLPVCPVSGVGQSTNQIYREDGQRCEGHEFEDRSFRFAVKPTQSLYAILDGHNGKRAAHFAAQRIPAELLLGQLDDRNTDEEVRNVLQQAFSEVERSYFESIDDLLVEKAKLQLEIPEELNSLEVCRQYPEVVTRLQTISSETATGTTAVIALLHNNKLYIANVGDSRALLCRKDKNAALQVMQLSVDHDTHNEDELLRLQQLGLDVEKLRSFSKIGNQYNTRCFGNYSVKGGYKDFDTLSVAREEPVIAQPDLCGGIQIDDTFSFLLLMSKGLYKSLEEATGTKDANWDIAMMVVEQFSMQTTMAGVVQAVVDKVVRLHHDSFVSDLDHVTASPFRKDITLLVRNFNHPFPKAVNSPTTSQSRSPSATVQSQITAQTQVGESTTTASTTTSESYDRLRMYQAQSAYLPLDENGRVESYVDFTAYYNAVAKVKANSKEKS